MMPWPYAATFLPSRRGVRGNGHIAMVGGRRWSDPTKEGKKEEAGRIGIAGFPSRRGIPSRIPREVFDRCGGARLRSRHEDGTPPFGWTPGGWRGLRSRWRFSSSGWTPRKNWVLPGEERGGAGRGYPPGGRWSRGWWPLGPRRCRSTGSRGRVGPGRWVAYDAAFGSQDRRKRNIENRRWGDACFIPSARSTATRRDLGDNQADNPISPRRRGSSWWPPTPRKLVVVREG
jgi:hypothetical protein